MTCRTDLDHARALDQHDALRRFRDRFFIDDPKLVYVDGNSLGRPPKDSVDRAERMVRHEWGQRLVRGWHDWLDLPERIGAKIARLVGATDGEVIVADSTSINLFKLVVAALRARPERAKVVTDDLNFPSDLYILQSALKVAGPAYHLEIVRSPDGLTVPIEKLDAAIDAETALVALSHTAFKSGFVYDMEHVTSLAHAHGALALWDLSHSVGVLPIRLDDTAADLAVGCTYKYLNGGPGAPAFLYVRRDLERLGHPTLENPITGWFGHADQFSFAPEYQPAGNMRRFLTGTPSILSLALIEPGVDLVLEAGIDRVRAKSIEQTEYLIALWQELLAPLGFRLNSPRDPACRGSHVSLGHTEGLRIARALIDQMHVVPDFRQPDNIRLGVSPLYTSYQDLHAAVTGLRTVVLDHLYARYPAERHGVT